MIDPATEPDRSRAAFAARGRQRFRHRARPC
jgi:hypothetical protein